VATDWGQKKRKAVDKKGLRSYKYIANGIPKTGFAGEEGIQAADQIRRKKKQNKQKT